MWTKQRWLSVRQAAYGLVGAQRENLS